MDAEVIGYGSLTYEQALVVLTNPLGVIEDPVLIAKAQNLALDCLREKVRQLKEAESVEVYYEGV